ncbi:MAG TPA: hypothetical protein PKM56_16675 [Candidatus Rifleibacterium sp.]|nr:hypothetical protein [Candidatus Rifleibacterium sp.]
MSEGCSRKMLIFPAAPDGTIAMENPTQNLVIDELKDMIKGSPDGQLHLWFIFCEDVYETRFGDGFYSYPHRAFQNNEEAEKWAKMVTTDSKTADSLGFNAEVHHIVASLNEAGSINLFSRDKELSIRDPERKIIDFLNGTDPDWQSIVRTLKTK